MKRQYRILLFVLAAAVVVFGLLLVSVRPYVDYLWMEELGQGEVFWTRIGAQVCCFVVGSLVGLLVTYLNITYAYKGGLAVQEGKLGDVRIKGDRVVVDKVLKIPRWVRPLCTLLVGIVTGVVAMGYFDQMLSYVYRVPFGQVDPLLGYEVATYVFGLPLFAPIFNLVPLSLLISSVVVLLIYGLWAGMENREELPPGLVPHFWVVTGCFLIALAPKYLLARLELIAGGTGIAAGAGYVDHTIRLPALFVLAAACVAAGIYLIASRRAEKWWKPVVVLFAVPFLSGLLLTLLPAAFQSWVVRPNELSLERPYIEKGIEFGLRGFGLQDIETRDYDATRGTSELNLSEHRGTIQNIRLWDTEPLLEIYRQLQALRQYYTFHDADVDRYTVAGDYRQVMLSAREITWERMDERAKTWVNQKLKYTHGYGAVMSPVNEVSREGQPSLWLRDIPPVAREGLDLDQPSLYYSEGSTWYVIVNSEEEELHYPQGDSNVYTHYEGTGGIPVSGLFRRLAMAIYFRDPNIVLSRSFTPDSRLMFARDVTTRLSRLAPSLRIDGDPYLVMSQGQFFWIADLYTVSKTFPYSPKQSDVNYVRNSVKAVVDAYQGDVRFYIVEQEGEPDPIVRTYQKIYPTLFTPLEEAPEGLRAHFRYPEWLFTLQSEVYKLYHMGDPGVFYNKEDVWETPTENFQGNPRVMEPYYMIMRLPGEEELEFVLMLPFTPSDRDNLIAWMAARCDGDRYGEMVVYQFPKDRLIYGPRQIETRIGQDTLISQQISLWDQSGTRVIRGSLLVIPLDGTVLYVQPLYLQGGTAQLPELKRVIVAAGEQVIMEPTLELALSKAVVQRKPHPSGTDTPPAETDAPPPGETRTPPPEMVKEVRSKARRAMEHFEKADQALTRRDWETYGTELKAAEELIRELAEENQ